MSLDPAERTNSEMKKKRTQDKGLRNRNGIWYVNIQINGSRKEFKVGPDRSDAVKLRKELKAMAAAGTIEKLLGNPEDSQKKYSEAVEEHWEGHLINLTSGKDALGRLKPSLKFFENRTVKSIKWEEVEKYRNKRLNEVTEGTVKQDLDMMSAVFKRQVKMGVITSNPLDNVDRPSVDNVREDIISHAELLRLLNVTWYVDNRGSITEKGVDFHLRLAMIIADFTAMRRGEILAMKWTDFRNDGTEIFIPKSKTRKKRHVPVHSMLSRILTTVPRNSLYVVNVNGEPIKSLTKGFEKARKSAGLDWVHFHDFRHRAITRWVQEGHPVNAIMKATGHSTFSAFSRYSNLKEGDIQVLVGRKTTPLPYVTFDEYFNIPQKNVAKVWQGQKKWWPKITKAS